MSSSSETLLSKICYQKLVLRRGFSIQCDILVKDMLMMAGLVFIREENIMSINIQNIQYQHQHLILYMFISSSNINF